MIELRDANEAIINAERGKTKCLRLETNSGRQQRARMCKIRMQIREQIGRLPRRGHSSRLLAEIEAKWS